MASRAALSSDFSRIIRLIETGKINPEAYITHRMKFEEIPQNFEKLYEYGSDLVKAIIEF